MKGLRNRLVHGYALVDSEKVWQAATTEVAALIASLERILASR